MTDHARCNDKIRDLEATIERMAAASIANATRYTADVAAERRAGALRVERIRSAILAGAADSSQQWASAEAFRYVDLYPDSIATVVKMSRAYLAQGEALREARADVARLREAAREMAT